MATYRREFVLTTTHLRCIYHKFNFYLPNTHSAIKIKIQKKRTIHKKAGEDLDLLIFILL